MNLRFDQLSELWGAPQGGPSPWTGGLVGVSTDSRAGLAGVLFVPLVGERFDGHRFLAPALASAAAAVAQRDRITPQELEDLVALGKPLWLVEDTLVAYQQLACLWRRNLGIPAVAVTGSAGKTTTRELIRAALAPLGPVVASSGNENNDVGTPLTLLKADSTTRALVVEMGMRGLGEIERLSRCTEPDVAVITNIGTAHIGRLGSRGAIASAKCEITAALRTDGLVVIPAGDPLLEATLAANWSGRVWRVALADELPTFASGLPAADRIGQLDPSGGEMRLEWSSVAPISLPLPGRHNARNLLLALAVAEELGVPLDLLTQLAVEVPGGRNRRLGIGGVKILDETYNASPEAMLAALDLLAAQAVAPGGSRYAVLGTMLELGDSSLELHRCVAERVVGLGLDGLVIVAGDPEGAAMAAAAAGLERLERVNDPEAALAPLLAWLSPGDVVLLKASRGVALERLIPLLQERLG